MLRLILDVPTYEGILDAAFLQVCQNLRQSLGVAIRVLEALQAIAITTTHNWQRDAVRLHAEMVYRAALEVAREKKDRNDLEERFQGVLQKLNASAGTAPSPDS